MPRLQILADDPAYTEDKERVFQEWVREVRLGEKCRLAMIGRGESGEAFLELVDDSGLRSPVKLNLVLIEPDRVTGQIERTGDPLYFDGILYDDNGNPVSYDVLNYHPGGPVVPVTGFGSYRQVPAARMLHFYRQTRPEQRRGVPDIAPALNLFGQLRRFTLAVLSAAEAAANASWLLVSQGRDVEPVDIDPMDTINLEHGSGMTLPAGWDMKQIDAKQPATTYAEFKRQILNEIARCLNMPLNVALADSSQYNYASGRLDHQTYFRCIEVDRYDLGVKVLSPIYRAWDDEYRRTAGAVISTGSPAEADAHEWYFDGFEHVDPNKEASAKGEDLKNLADTYQNIYGRKGIDWRKAFRDIAEARKFAKELDIPLPAAAPAQPAAPAADEDQQGDNADEQPPAAAPGQRRSA
jgi:capsid protein